MQKETNLADFSAPYLNIGYLHLVQAAYNVGGQTFSAETIETSILGCRSNRQGQVV